MFLKARDLKEARVDEALEVIGDLILVHIPPRAMDGQDWYKLNVEHSNRMALELQMKSQSAEEAVVELINKFVEGIKDENIDQEEKFRWIDPNKLEKPVFAIKPRGNAGTIF